MATSTEQALVMRRDIITAVVAYSACSSLMLVMNKVAMYHIPFPSLVTSIQLIFAVVVVVILKEAGIIEADNLTLAKIKPYMIYIAAFTGGIYCNMRALQGSNVETVIVFRSCTPLAVGVLDWIFLGRELPSARSVAALLLILLGAIGYVMTDKAFLLGGMGAYFWVAIYFCLICFEMTYGKRIVSSVPMQSVWGSVYYTNVLAVLPMVALGLAMQEQGSRPLHWTPSGLLSLTISCVIGIGISYSGWNCRMKISATSFTLVGVLNKLITVLINCMLWDQHASMVGILSLTICISGGALYQQAPLRAAPVGSEEDCSTCRPISPGDHRARDKDSA